MSESFMEDNNSRLNAAWKIPFVTFVTFGAAESPLYCGKFQDYVVCCGFRSQFARLSAAGPDQPVGGPDGHPAEYAGGAAATSGDIGVRFRY